MSLEDLKPHIKLTIDRPGARSDSAFGPGVAALCRGVRETGSLNAAAKNMGMAYSKAWRIVKDTEAALGVQMLIRDGARGSYLTEEGTKLLDSYDKLNRIMQELSKEKYLEILD